MRDTFWLILNAKGAVGIRKGRRAKWHALERPALGRGEYAVALTVDVPDSAFAPSPLPSATLTIPESALVAPAISVELEDPPQEATT